MSMLLGTAYAQINLDNSRFMRGISQTEQAINRLGTYGAKGMGAFDEQVGRATSRMGAMGTVAGGLGTVIAAPFLGGINMAANFEQGMSGVTAALGASGPPPALRSSNSPLSPMKHSGSAVTPAKAPPKPQWRWS